MNKIVKISNFAQILFYISLAIYIFLGILEIMAYWKKEFWSTLAVYVWIVLGVYFVVISIYLVGKTFIQDLKLQFIRGIFVLLLFSILILFFPNLLQFINHESTQQASAGFSLIQKADFNYTGQSFLGYPSRQYLITTLPSFLFGRTPFLLNLGYIIPFLFGLYIFYSGMRAYFDNDKDHAIISTIGIISIFLFSYVFPLIFMYEQSVIPLSITLCAVGWLLITFKKPTFLHFLALLWIGSLLSGIYSPGFASWLLLVVVEIFQCLGNFRIKNNKLGVIWLCIVLTTVIFGVMSIWGVNSANAMFTGLRNPDYEKSRDVVDLLMVLKEGYEIFFSLSESGKSFTQSLIYLPLVVYIVSSILLRNGIKNFLLVSWILITVGISLLLKGYASPPPVLSIQRALVVVPPLLIGILVWIDKKHIHLSRLFLNVYFSVALLIVLISYIQTYNSVGFGQNDLRATMVHQILYLKHQNKIDPSIDLNIFIYSDVDSIISLQDMTQYFVPLYKITFLSDCSNYVDLNNNTILFTDSIECTKKMYDEGIDAFPLFDPETHFYYALIKNK